MERIVIISLVCISLAFANNNKIVTSPGPNEDVPNCEDRERGDQCYMMFQTPFVQSCPSALCYYQPSMAYYKGAEVEVYKSQNGNYPPRILTETCKYPDYPCHETSYQPRYMHMKLWCPPLKCNYDTKETIIKKLKVKINGVWKKRNVSLNVPRGCTCERAPCNTGCVNTAVGVYYKGT